MKPKKSQEGQWVKLRKFGEIGERFIESYMLKKGVLVIPLNLYTMADKSNKVMDWAELKKYPKVPDFIANDRGNIFLFDVKTKRKFNNSTYNFLVNKRDYGHYLKFNKVCPVKIYFLFLDHKDDVLSIFTHDVGDRKYPESIAWDKNV